MSDTYGRTSARQFAYYDPATSSWRMSPGTDPSGSTEFSQTWPRTGCMSGGRAFERPTLVPRTTATGCSSLPHLPTPTASDYKRPNGPSDNRRKSPNITAVDTYFTTPTASDGTVGGTHPSRRQDMTAQLIDTVLSIGDDTPPLFGDGSN